MKKALFQQHGCHQILKAGKLKGIFLTKTKLKDKDDVIMVRSGYISKIPFQRGIKSLNLDIRITERHLILDQFEGYW